MRLVVLFLLFFALNYYGQELQYYSCFIDRIDVDEWAKNGKRTFDNDGIILNEGRYHPLGVVHYGMLNYYAFVEGGDSSYYHQFINQVKFFQDYSKLHYKFDGKGIGLPYTFNFHDLKAPWYSGMTQGYALSFLLRYRDLTGDESITPTIQKIAFLMIQPQENGGTIGKTPEGYTFIEEYPNAKSREVFNGFVNGLIGLKEYCDFFPEDTLAKRMHDESLQGAIKTMGAYDGVEWSNYNRSGTKCSVKYMRYEIFELKHLFEIYKDSAFLDQMKLWSVYAHNKFNTEKQTVFKLKKYNTSEELLFNIDNQQYYSKVMLDTLFYSNIERTVAGEIQLLKSTKKSIKYTVFLDSSAAFNYIDFKYAASSNCKKISIKSTEGDLDLTIKNPENQHIFQLLEKPISTTKLEIEIKGGKEPNLSDIFLSALQPFKVPFYQFYKKSPQEMSAGTYLYDIDHSLNADDITLFYRVGKDQKTVKNIKWSTAQMVRGKSGDFTIEADGSVQFMVVYAPNMPYSEIGELNLSKK